MTIDILALANEAAATAVNMNEASTGGGGGEYTPPAEGWARARLVAYVEGGDHEKSIGAGKPTVIKPQVRLIFELSGAKHAPTKLDDGTLLPYRITENFNAGRNYGALNEKSGLYKLFLRMNYDQKATHMSQLLGQPFLVNIRHEVRGEGENKRTYVSIRDKAGEYQVKAPRQENFEDDTITEIKVDPAISPLRLFIWNASPDVVGKMWDTLFIEGEYPERKNQAGVVTASAKSKNVLQDWCKSALNLKGSALGDYLDTGGVELTLGAAADAVGAAVKPQPSQNTGTTTSPSDPLAAI